MRGGDNVDEKHKEGHYEVLTHEKRSVAGDAWTGDD
jgi:hypothetical protein